MSVLACDRDGCSNVMCDILVDGRYYLCDDCARLFERIVGSAPRTYTEMQGLFQRFLGGGEWIVDAVTVHDFLERQ